MKGIPIKFRGKAHGRYYYGDYERCYEGDGKYFGDEYYCIKCPQEDSEGNKLKKFTSIRVDEESIAQLIGYDANKKEVYEDDILVDKNGNRIKAGTLAIQPERIWNWLLRDEFNVERQDDERYTN